MARKAAAPSTKSARRASPARCAAAAPPGKNRHLKTSTASTRPTAAASSNRGGLAARPDETKAPSLRAQRSNLVPLSALPIEIALFASLLAMTSPVCHSRTAPTWTNLRSRLARGFGGRLGFEDAAADLVTLDRFEKGAKIAFAEAFVALALDDLEEDRADHGFGEDLQQQALSSYRGAVDQDSVAAQPREILAVSGDTAVDRLVIGVGDRHERDAARFQSLDGRIDVCGGQRDVLDALAVIGFEIFGDLRLVVGALVDRDPDLPARARHC